MLSNELIRRPPILYLWEITIEENVYYRAVNYGSRGRGGGKEEKTVSFSSLLLPLKN
jgi:hypothetical protein